MNLDDLLKEICAPCRCREAREALKTKMRCCPEFNLVAYPKEGRELVAFHAEVTEPRSRSDPTNVPPGAPAGPGPKE